MAGAADALTAARGREGAAARDRHMAAQLVEPTRHAAQPTPCIAGPAGLIIRTTPSEPHRTDARLVGFLREAAMKPRPIPSTMTTMFEYDYATAEAELRRLYENAKRDQWNASRDIPWATPGTDDGRVI